MCASFTNWTRLNSFSQRNYESLVKNIFKKVSTTWHYFQNLTTKFFSTLKEDLNSWLEKFNQLILWYKSKWSPRTKFYRMHLSIKVHFLKEYLLIQFTTPKKLFQAAKVTFSKSNREWCHQKYLWKLIML